MCSETEEPAAGSLPDRGKHGSFQGATAAVAHVAASIPVISSFALPRFTGTMQPRVAGFVNLWEPGPREARTWAVPLLRDGRES